jgi:hypothetical protein
MLFTASSFDAAAHARQNRDGSGSNGGLSVTINSGEGNREAHPGQTKIHEILQAGNSQSQNHIAKVALTPHLQMPGLPPGDYKFSVCSSSALAAPASAHIVGFDMGGADNHFHHVL